MPTSPQSTVVKLMPQPARGMPKGQEHFVQLDGLRTLAVSSVAWSHWASSRYLFGLPWGTGVQLFFVLSGFLITGILMDATPEEPNQSLSSRFGIWRSFYARRFLRIFPLYYAVLAVAFLLGVGPIATTWKWHVAYLSNFFFVHQGGWGNPIDPFRHFWSLAVEEQFYLVWPFLILLLSRGTLLKVLIGMIVTAPLFRIVMYWVGIDVQMIHLLPFSCLDALGIGSLFAYLMRSPISTNRQARRLAGLCLWFGLLGCLVFTFLERTLNESFIAGSIGHFCLVLFYGWVVYQATLGFKGFAGLFLRSRVMAYLGKISYGLYVFHHFAPFATSMIAHQIGVSALLGASVPLQLFLNVFFTLILAMSSWHLLESPLNKLKRHFPYTQLQQVSK